MERVYMNVSFYGHVRQYHNIRSEIDSNIHEVLESGQYVMGPALKRFENEFADYHGMKYACGVAKRNGCFVACVPSVGHRRG
jgi:dTDP-4-amino-4,6-dideoxygalactose transaminase